MLLYVTFGFSQENIFNKDYIFSYYFQGFYDNEIAGDYRFQFDYEEYWKDYESEYHPIDDAGYVSNKDGDWGYTEDIPSEPHYWKKYYKFCVINLFEDKIEFGSNGVARTNIKAIADSFEVLEKNTFKYHIETIQEENEYLLINPQYKIMAEKESPFDLFITKDGDFLQFYIDEIKKENFLFELAVSNKKDINAMEKFHIGKISNKPEVNYPKYEDGRCKYIVKNYLERVFERGKYYRIINSCTVCNNNLEKQLTLLNKNEIVLFLNYEETTYYLNDYPNDSWLHIFLYDKYNMSYIDGYIFGSNLNDYFLEEIEIPEEFSNYVKKNNILEEPVTEINTRNVLPIIIVIISVVILAIILILIILIKKRKRNK